MCDVGERGKNFYFKITHFHHVWSCSNVIQKNNFVFMKRERQKLISFNFHQNLVLTYIYCWQNRLPNCSKWTEIVSILHRHLSRKNDDFIIASEIGIGILAVSQTNVKKNSIWFSEGIKMNGLCFAQRIKNYFVYPKYSVNMNTNLLIRVFRFFSCWFCPIATNEKRKNKNNV